jgi:hypothetical protein
MEGKDIYPRADVSQPFFGRPTLVGLSFLPGTPRAGEAASRSEIASAPRVSYSVPHIV